MHYYAKRRVELGDVFDRVRGGGSLRDIGRCLGYSRTTVASAVMRLGRQAIACHCALMQGLRLSGPFVFDGLMSAVATRDYPSHITTLVEASTEMVLAMTHCVTERGGRRTASQTRRIKARRAVWRPRINALKDAIALLVRELPRFAEGVFPLCIDTDEYPFYPVALAQDLAMQWYAANGMLVHRRTPGSALRTTANRLFAVNYVDRMIRHRVKEHTRESIAIGRNSSMQMFRMWIFAWDHNVNQPHRVKAAHDECRAIKAGADAKLVDRLTREFFTRRRSLRSVFVPESMRQVWLAQLQTPPLRWKTRGTSEKQFTVPAYARLDLSFAVPQGP